MNTVTSVCVCVRVCVCVMHILVCRVSCKGILKAGDRIKSQHPRSKFSQLQSESGHLLIASLWRPFFLWYRPILSHTCLFLQKIHHELT